MILSRPRRYRANSTGLLAKKFIERLERGVLADRTKDTRRGQSLKLIPVPRALQLQSPTTTGGNHEHPDL